MTNNNKGKLINRESIAFIISIISLIFSVIGFIIVNLNQ